MNQKRNSSSSASLKSKVTYIVILVFTKVDNMEITLQYLHETACMETLFAKKLENALKKQIFSELPNDTLFILRVILTIPSEIRERERRRDAFHLPRWWPPKADTFFRL